MKVELTFSEACKIVTIFTKNFSHVFYKDSLLVLKLAQISLTKSHCFGKKEYATRTFKQNISVSSKTLESGWLKVQLRCFARSSTICII